MQDSLVLELDG
ncbi:Protein of unknown function [Propionibacterium freudenreichii]|nr:Protein of unknown function [Propionibacterium freudenreichii]CEG93270.1 Protein of unknown function [Propionibacterium freudenreichii]CEI47608.1 Protein of unknown function [Propionibacterium freudenreichii]CEI48630.1 Protein of unknown function [Propionibacterium freudenreichii]